MSFDFDIGEFCLRYNLQALKVLHAFRFLEKDNYLNFSEALFLPSRIRMLLDKGGLYKFQVAHAGFDPVLKAILRSCGGVFDFYVPLRSEEHTSELQSLMRISYAVFCLKKKKKKV